MTVTRSKVLTHLEAVEGRQRRYRATVHAAYSAGTFTPETRVRARRAFGVLRVKRIRLSEWLNTHPRPPDDRQDLHNVSVDEQVADAGCCGQVHLATGRTCTLEGGHHGSCDFVSPEQVQESVQDRRPDQG